MKRSWLLAPLILVVLAAVWLIGNGKGDAEAIKSMLGMKSATPPISAKSKPICSQVIVPAGTDCIPQHLANLPPDPGQAGMTTIEGIDSDKDGVRDDVQRFIVLNYGHSERAVQALRAVAKGVQQEISVGGDITPDDAKALAEEIVLKPVSCFVRSVEAVDPSMRKVNAVSMVVTEVTNTPERYARKRQFEVKAANSVYPLSNASTAELCGYDPSSLPN